MTMSQEKPPAISPQPDSLRPAAETLGTEIRKELGRLADQFGEHSIGAPSAPGDSGFCHTRNELKKIHDNEKKTLILNLKEWSVRASQSRVYPLICLWHECLLLWDASMAYRTVRVVEEATASFVRDATATAASQSRAGWEHSALCAAGGAMRLITADADVFKQINLSSAEGLAKAAETAASTAELILAEVGSPLAALGSGPGAPEEGSDRIAEGLRDIENTARQSQIFYTALVHAAQALITFENWLAAAPRLGSGPAVPSAAGPPGPQAPPELLADIDTAIDEFGRAQKSLSGVILSRSEPWERLLFAIQAIAASSDDAAAASQVFVPKRVSIRYCYPFAVEASEQARLGPDRVKADLGQALADMGIRVGDPEPLTPTEFFAQHSGLYGGLRVNLPAIELRYERPPGLDSDGRPERCRVWIDLSDLGNHCLCVEPEPLDAPLPHLLYRALRAGTPFALGATAVVAGPPAGTETEVAWDDLHAFSRDVIGAIAHAGFWPIDHDLPDAERSVRGNLHEIIVVRTDPLGDQPEDIADHLDRATGGRILLRSIQRAATTLDEWVRYPPVRRAGSQGLVPTVAGLPEMGLAGDWCTHTGETTVFGIVAAPSWHSDVYMEAAQFVSSWSPLLRLWSKRLLNAIQTPPSDGDKDRDKERDAEKLRGIERQIRLHLVQIKAEELCVTLAHRRFLDQLLEMAGLGRLQGELEAQLGAAEHLTDWLNESAHRKSEKSRQQADQTRQLLLSVIALFGLFNLATYLSLANTTGFHTRFLFLTVRPGVWEDWLMLISFVLAVLAGVYFFFDLQSRLPRYLGVVRRRLRPGGSGPPSRGATPS